jgi:hypothetical protein
MVYRVSWARTADEACERERIRHLGDNLGTVGTLKLAVRAAGGADRCDQRGHHEHCVWRRRAFAHSHRGGKEKAKMQAASCRIAGSRDEVGQNPVLREYPNRQ